MVTTVMAVVGLVGALSAVVGPMVWAAFAIEVLLAAGFTYHLATPRG